MLRYENAQPSDLPAIADLFQSAFPEALTAVFGKTHIPSAALTDLLKGVFANEPDGFFVAKEGNRLVGFMIGTSHLGKLYRRLLLRGTLLAMAARWLLGRYSGLGVSFVPRIGRLWWDYRKIEKEPDVAGTSAAQLLSIVVDQAAQRQGIGRRLMELSLNYLRRTSAKVVRLEVDAAKEGPVKLYKEFGFKEVARIPTPRGPALIMTLPLESFAFVRMSEL